jgi:hypothetical protein
MIEGYYKQTTEKEIYVGRFDRYEGKLRIALLSGGGMLLDHLSNIKYLDVDADMMDFAQWMFAWAIEYQGGGNYLTSDGQMMDVREILNEWRKRERPKADLSTPDDLKDIKLGQEQ